MHSIRCAVRLYSIFFSLACSALLAGSLAGCGSRKAAGESDPAAPRSVAISAPFGIRFANVAKEAGLAYVWPNQPKPMRNIEAFGAGCAFLDYDDDGWMDILLVANPHPILYHNLRNGRFEDVTAAAGLDRIAGDWKGVAVGDYDCDGRLDLVLTGFRRLALLRNLDGRRFQEVTREAGLDPANHNHWGASAALMDLDGDSRPELVLLNYVIFGPNARQYCELRPGIKSGCPPSEYEPEFGEMWQNLGGRFKDVTKSSGMLNTHGKGLVLAFTDLNDDGKLDFYAGNDGTPGDFLLNRGRLRFENIAEKSGLAFGSMPGHSLAAMGVDWADYDHDGRLDLTVTSFSDDSYAVFHNLGDMQFEHTENQLGIAGPTLKPLGFGAKWIDADNDGWPDILYNNGHVYDNTNDIDPFSTYRQPPMLFRNDHGRAFTDIAPQIGGDMAFPIVGRGSATGDFDNDGREDALLVDYEGPPVLLHNLSETSHHWITLDLRGEGRNRFAYGARVTVFAGKVKYVGQVSPVSSYLSSSDPRVHFGIGDTPAIDRVEIRWLNGETESVMGVPVDRIVRIEEGRGVVDAPRGP